MYITIIHLYFNLLTTSAKHLLYFHFIIFLKVLDYKKHKSNQFPDMTSQFVLPINFLIFFGISYVVCVTLHEISVNFF